MNEPTLTFFRFLAFAPDVARAFAKAHAALSTRPAVHAVMSDEREFVAVEGGASFEIERTGYRDEMGEELLVFKSAALPASIADEQIAEQAQLYARFVDVAKAAGEGRLRAMTDFRMSVVPQQVQQYLQKPVAEQRQWIEFDATADEWNSFIDALRSIPEPEQSLIWTWYVMHPHSEVISRRHPSRPPRGAA